MRTVIGHRSKSIQGPYEGKVLLQSNGVAQGSVLQMVDGSWMGYLFQDNGSVGRSPWLVPVTWVDGWPVFNNGVAPTSFSLPSLASVNQPVVGSSAGTGIATSDNFAGSKLFLEWQINHNPDNANWSLTQRPGYYRIRTGRIDANVLLARNTLTQRSFGPKSSGRVSLDVSGMKDGDVAGLLGLQAKYGYVGVKRSGTTNTVVMVNAGVEAATAPLAGNKVYLRIDMDFTNRTDKATFFYSTDSTTWKPIGTTLQMNYDLDHFMGYRFGLFNFATKSTGGTADFDWYEVGSSVSQRLDMHPNEQTSNVRFGQRVAGGLEAVQISSDRSLLIDFRQDHAGKVGISLVNVQGRIVRSILEDTRSGGVHTLTYRPTGLPNGLYSVVQTLDGRVMGSRALSWMN